MEGQPEPRPPGPPDPNSPLNLNAPPLPDPVAPPAASPAATGGNSITNDPPSFVEVRDRGMSEGERTAEGGPEWDDWNDFVRPVSRRRSARRPGVGVEAPHPSEAPKKDPSLLLARWVAFQFFTAFAIAYCLISWAEDMGFIPSSQNLKWKKGASAAGGAVIFFIIAAWPDRPQRQQAQPAMAQPAPQRAKSNSNLRQQDNQDGRSVNGSPRNSFQSVGSMPPDYYSRASASTSAFALGLGLHRGSIAPHEDGVIGYTRFPQNRRKAGGGGGETGGASRT